MTCHGPTPKAVAVNQVYNYGGTSYASAFERCSIHKGNFFVNDRSLHHCRLVEGCSPIKETRVTNRISWSCLRMGITREWKTNELAIKYQYRMTPETLKIAGTTNWSVDLPLDSPILHTWQCTCYFLTTRELLLKTPLFMREKIISLFRFPCFLKKQYPYLREPKQFPFAYDGELADSGHDGGAAYNIWLSPSR